MDLSDYINVPAIIIAPIVSGFVAHDYMGNYSKSIYTAGIC